MLKGLKLKTKLPDKTTDTTTTNQSSQPSRITEEELTSSSNPNKRWLKTNDGLPPQKKVVVEEEQKLTEHDLIRVCEDIWESWKGGQTKNTESLWKELKKKEHRFFETLHERTNLVNEHIIGDREEDMFASVEQTALRNFDQRKSAYLVTDLISETVRSKGKGNDDEIYNMYKKKAIRNNPENLYDEEYDAKEVEEAENKKKSKKDKKIEQKSKQREAMQSQKIQRILADCRFCLGNNQIIEEQILSFSPSLILILPDIKKYEKDHFYILPVDHVSSQVELDEDQFEEVRNYMKCLTAMYDKKNYGIIFMESYVNIEKSPHCIIECIATKREIHDELPMYFKKALLELESEWATHKKIIEIKKEKGGIRKQIPPNFPYFFIDFDTTFGYAHVIEKTKDYNKNFAHEIFGMLLEVDKSMTMFPKKFSRSELVDMKEEFLNDWNDYDWTKAL